MSVSESQEEFGWRTGLSQAAISQYETGKRIPDLRAFTKMWRTYNIEPLALVLMFINDIEIPNEESINETVDFGEL